MGIPAAPSLPAFAPRPLTPQLYNAPTVADGHLAPTSVPRATIGNDGKKPHGLIARPAVSLWGNIVATGGWPAPIRRTASFAVLPRPPLPVTIQIGVNTSPGNARRGR